MILRSSETAFATVERTDNPVENETTCPQLAGILITPPITRFSVKLDRVLGDCSGQEIHPIVKGFTGRQDW